LRSPEKKPSVVSEPDVLDILRDLALPDFIVADVLDALPKRAFGVVLYGSVARGDYSDNSDIDLLVISDAPHSTRAAGKTNVSTYDMSQFLTADGTLFGMHLARDGVVLHDGDSEITGQLVQFRDVDTARLWGRVRDLARLLTLPLSEQHARLDGFIRHARYVLRTATYARALEGGRPCFSVVELAERFNDPQLQQLLSSHSQVQGPPTIETLENLTTRIQTLLGKIEPIHLASLTDVIVEHDDTDLGDSAVLLLGSRDGSPYTVIPRVIL